VALATKLRVELPRTVAVSAEAEGGGLHTTRRIEWTVPAGSLLRLQQLLAQAGYLPLGWRPAGVPVARTPSGELQAAVDAPKGRFGWRYPNTPRELRALWRTGHANEITRGAVMMFEDDHGLEVDGLAGAKVWQSLLADAIAGKRRAGGYSYVYVHSSVPQSLTLWHNGRTVLSSPGNTGVPAAPTCSARAEPRLRRAAIRLRRQGLPIRRSARSSPSKTERAQPRAVRTQRASTLRHRLTA
jgi:peptidoglycan hydrolase-like protein with peptidoglycan-binding domain